MSQLHTATKFIIGHILAGSVVILGTLLITAICYIIGLWTAPNAFDTPMSEIPTFLAVLLYAGVFAVIISTISFVISAFLTWLRTKQNFSAWLPLILVPPILSTAFVLIYRREGGWQSFIATTLIAFIYFGIYWSILICSGAVIDFLRAKLFQRT